jgi:hypothetical protein
MTVRVFGISIGTTFITQTGRSIRAAANLKKNNNILNLYQFKQRAIVLMLVEV